MLNAQNPNVPIQLFLFTEQSDACVAPAPRQESGNVQ